MDREKLLRLIHIARNSARTCPECGKTLFRKDCPDCGTLTVRLSEERYRSILESFGASSCRFMAEPELEKVYRFFIQAGFLPRGDPEKSRNAARRRTIAIISSEAKELFGDEAWERRVEGFVRKGMGKDSLRACDDKELRKVIGWLRRYRKYLTKKNEERDNEKRD